MKLFNLPKRARCGDIGGIRAALASIREANPKLTDSAWRWVLALGASDALRAGQWGAAFYLFDLGAPIDYKLRRGFGIRSAFADAQEAPVTPGAVIQELHRRGAPMGSRWNRFEGAKQIVSPTAKKAAKQATRFPAPWATAEGRAQS